LVSGDYPHIEAYLAAPPTAGLEWLWDYPAGWTYADFDRVRKIGGISVLEYIRSYGLVILPTPTPGHLATRKVVTVPRGAEVPPAIAEVQQLERPGDKAERGRRRYEQVTIGEAIKALETVELPPLDRRGAIAG
jgi:hypothetical protein